MKIRNSTIQNNKLGYFGAIYFGHWRSGKPPVTGKNDLLLENLVLNNNSNKVAETPVSPDSLVFIDSPDTENVTIKNVYVHDNILFESSVDYLDILKSGGIMINQRDDMKIDISGSSFARNESSGSGALTIGNKTGIAKSLQIRNNTFYGNKSKASFEDATKTGALYIEGAYGGGSDQFLTNNTFYNNSIERDQENMLIPDVVGAALNVADAAAPTFLKNELLVGNHLMGNDSPSKDFENVHFGSDAFEVKSSLGVDNGSVTKDTVAQVYGKYPVGLDENGSTIKAGRTKNAVVIPTVMIAPKMVDSAGTLYTGFANMRGLDAVETDQRGLKRTSNHDIGAIEIASLVYDSNKGAFTLQELTKYDGKTYYEGKNPKQYAKVGNPNSSFRIIDGNKVLKPVRAGYVFIGWSNVKDATLANSKFNSGKKL